MKPTNKQEKEVNKICCPKCKSKNFKKNGKRKTENRGLIQRYLCNNCGYRFTHDEGFFRMRNHPNKITCAIDLFYKGVSTRKVQEHFQAFYPHNSSHKSIYKWIIKYSKMISKYTDKLKLVVGSELQVDEQEHHRLGNKNWFIDAIDTETRFMVSSGFYNKRGSQEIKVVLRIAKYKTENQITLVQTDSWMAYRKCLNKTFGLHKRKALSKITHRKLNASKGDGFNCRIERLHNTIKERTKTIRGFHGCLDSANAIMKGLEVHYNFIRKHQSINCCPYELAVPELKDKLGVNKWLGLIELAKLPSK